MGILYSYRYFHILVHIQMKQFFILILISLLVTTAVHQLLIAFGVPVILTMFLAVFAGIASFLRLLVVYHESNIS